MPKMKRVKTGNLIVKVELYVAVDNEGSPMPDFIIVVYLFGIKILERRITI